MIGLTSWRGVLLVLQVPIHMFEELNSDNLSSPLPSPTSTSYKGIRVNMYDACKDATVCPRQDWSQHSPCPPTQPAKCQGRGVPCLTIISLWLCLLMSMGEQGCESYSHWTVGDFPFSWTFIYNFPLESITITSSNYTVQSCVSLCVNFCRKFCSWRSFLLTHLSSFFSYVGL